MLPVAGIIGMLGKRDWVYMAVIGVLLITIFVGRAHYRGEVAAADMKTAAALIEQANLSNKLGEKIRELEISKTNEIQAEKDSKATRAWAEEYVKGCSLKVAMTDAQLMDCVRALPPEDPKATTPKGVSYEKGKRSMLRIRDMATGGVSTANPETGSSKAD